MRPGHDPDLRHLHVTIWGQLQDGKIFNYTIQSFATGQEIP